MSIHILCASHFHRDIIVADYGKKIKDITIHIKSPGILKHLRTLHCNAIQPNEIVWWGSGLGGIQVLISRRHVFFDNKSDEGVIMHTDYTIGHNSSVNERIVTVGMLAIIVNKRDERVTMHTDFANHMYAVPDVTSSGSVPLVSMETRDRSNSTEERDMYIHPLYAESTVRHEYEEIK